MPVARAYSACANSSSRRARSKARTKATGAAASPAASGARPRARIPMIRIASRSVRNRRKNAGRPAQQGANSARKPRGHETGEAAGDNGDGRRKQGILHRHVETVQRLAQHVSSEHVGAEGKGFRRHRKARTRAARARGRLCEEIAERDRHADQRQSGPAYSAQDCAQPERGGTRARGVSTLMAAFPGRRAHAPPRGR